MIPKYLYSEACPTDCWANVSFSVKLQDGLTDTFQTSIGVKQGCILIPSMFSLYMNDLVDYFDFIFRGLSYRLLSIEKRITF
jgi:hypothetical protein